MKQNSRNTRNSSNRATNGGVNPSTTISFSISNSEFVTLKVFDVLGSGVAILVNEEKPAGNYEVNFNEEGLSSGIYFYKLQAG